MTLDMPMPARVVGGYQVFHSRMLLRSAACVDERRIVAIDLIYHDLRALHEHYQSEYYVCAHDPTASE
jgi:hypothetical protein